MNNIIVYLVCWLTKLIISLRYKVKIEGVSEVKKALPLGKGVLILPNHSAEIDPVLVMIALWPQLKPQPVVVEEFFYMQGIHFIMTLVKAFPCPNMEMSANRWKIRQLKKLEEKIVQGLKEGKRYLIYPSGKLKVSQEEILGGASFIPGVIRQVPDISLVMVRTTGLWGSSFSRALTGKVPDFGQTLLKGAKTICQNLLFFTPRRRVTIECALAPAEMTIFKERYEINRGLEAWYNQVEDSLVRVRQHFWSHKLPSIVVEESKEPPKADISCLTSEKKDLIIAKIVELANVPKEAVEPGRTLVRDLGLDSLDTAQLVAFLDERFEVKDVSPADFQTVADLFVAVILHGSGAGKKIAQEAKSIQTAVPRIKKEKDRPSPQAPQGNTIQEAFLRSCDRMGNAIACVDGMAGVFSYKRLKVAALILSKEIRKLPGENIGILLPSSVGAYLTILAVLLAKKTPVMLNWTAGVKALDHAAEVARLDVVLSSYKFLTKLRDLELGVIEDKIQLLEDLRHEIGISAKLCGLWKSFFKTETLLKHLGLADVGFEDRAVILFTSGTESLPKGVPLSHKNVLSNQKSAVDTVTFENADLFYGVLPPFHSFGFSVTGLFPLLSGIKVAYAPDPTDGHTMARDIATYHATIFCCAPSFLHGLFQVAEPAQLFSLRMIVAGAEKTPESLFAYVAKLGNNAELLEGYGITECSPVVTICRPGETRIGVGRPLEGVQLCTIDPETGVLLALGKQGEVCIHGPNVFNGYLGSSRNPFIEIDGKKWYRSGDLGIIAPDGSLVLAGRFKRFVKIGGEMVSLGGLEEEILEIMKEKEWSYSQEEVKGAPMALCAAEKDGEKTLLVLFTVYPLEREPINVALKHRGYSNLVRIHEVRHIKEIPLTGTGKTDYRSLEQTL